jgi:hypothetical protein
MKYKYNPAILYELYIHGNRIVISIAISNVTIPFIKIAMGYGLYYNYNVKRVNLWLVLYTVPCCRS